MKKKRTRKEIAEKMHDEIKNLFETFNLSGILYIPGMGTMSLFADENGKLRVLDHSRTELMYEKKQRDNKTDEWLLEKILDKPQSKKRLNYIG